MGGANFQVYHGRHPNVVEIKKVMAAKQKIFFAMAARKNFQLLVIALKLCHNHGVSHCDLKLENLLLDFGLSALPEHHLNDGLIHMQCGTPAYTSLEVMWKKGYDGAQANIWSCSVIITNAFKFISSISSVFDLSNLFENGQCPTIVVVSISPEMQSV